MANIRMRKFFHRVREVSLQMYYFIRDNLGTMVILVGGVYLAYTIYKVFHDDGLDENGNKYYSSFGEGMESPEEDGKSDTIVVE